MRSQGSDIIPSLGDRYAVEREVGRGGMAVVYLAQDRKHGRKVAIKVMAEEIARRIGPDHFLHEIEVAARLNHPHILPLFDSGMADGRLYYVMPFIEGESLRARLRRESRLSLAEAIRIAREIAGALQHAHTRGLVHRDIKPENVLLAEGIPLVADFGAACAVRIGATDTESPDAAGLDVTCDDAPHDHATMQLRETAPSGPLAGGGAAPGRPASGGASGSGGRRSADGTSGGIVGTPLYMAPEQAAGRLDLDGRADQYALGCLLFELLAGEPPFRGRTVSEVLQRHSREAPRDIASIRPEVPEDVAGALARTLAKDPKDRFPTMTQFIESLHAAAVRAYAAALREGDDAGIPNNLPIATTSFIGREKEMAEVGEILTRSRLVTLTGSGGTGKTRLGLQVALELLERFPDGVWMVELAPVSDPALVPKASAAALGIREAAGEPLIDTITAALQKRRALLLLDNCEHVLDAAAQLLHRLLTACPSLRVLASSREALGLDGESTYRVPSLSVPPAEGPVTPELVLGSGAAQLFVERAVAGRPEFRVTPQNATALAGVCRRLDGVPLAIELAAARVRVLTVEQIEERLDNRFRLLTGGSRTALPRQQTLRALIDWSFELLKDPEKLLFTRLSVFSGGWTLESSESVCSTLGIEEWEVLDLLTSLVDKSLVVCEENEGAARYRMLETIRQYARDRALEGGDVELWRDRHLDHFLALGETAAPHLTGANQDHWLRRLEAEHDNVRTALDWAGGTAERSAKGLRMCGALRAFWLARGHYGEGRARYAQALAQDPGDDRASRARALNGAANLAFSQADYAAARSLHEEGLAIRRAMGDRNGIATSLNNLGSISYFEGDVDSAYERIAESLAIRRELGDRAGVGSCLNNLAMIAQKREDLATAELHLKESLAIRRELGDRSGIAACLHNLGVLAMQQQELDTALALWEESLAIRRDMGDRNGVATSLQTLGALALARHQTAEARGRFLDSLRLYRELGNPLGVAAGFEGLAPVAVQCGDLARAIRFFAVAARIRDELGAPAPGFEQRVREQEIEETRREIGSDAFDAAWAAGWALSIEDAADLAEEGDIVGAAPKDDAGATKRSGAGQ